MENDAILTQLEPHDIASVVRTWNTEHVNKYLACGWLITALVKQQTGPDSYSLDYHLGWPRKLGTPLTPDLGKDFGSFFSSENKASSDAVEGPDVPF